MWNIGARANAVSKPSALGNCFRSARSSIFALRRSSLWIFRSGTRNSSVTPSLLYSTNVITISLKSFTNLLPILPVSSRVILPYVSKDFFAKLSCPGYLEHNIFYIGNIYDGTDAERHKKLLETYLVLSHPICKGNPDLCNPCSFYSDCPQHFCSSHNLLSGSTITENPIVVCM